MFLFFTLAYTAFNTNEFHSFLGLKKERKMEAKKLKVKLKFKCECEHVNEQNAKSNLI